MTLQIDKKCFNINSIAINCKLFRKDVQILESDERRKKIISILTSRQSAVSGTELSELLNVSRQVIVQDIALLRAVNKSILSTNKGYILYTNESHKHRRSFCVKHTDDQIPHELEIIVDNSGKVLDVVIEHDIYGQITVDLIINSRRDIKDFLQKLKDNKTKPLKDLTDGLHYHTVEADSEEDLDIIEEQLRKGGYLVE